MDKKVARVKQEDCEWGELESFYEKGEGREGRISPFKEEECREDREGRISPFKEEECQEDREGRISAFKEEEECGGGTVQVKAEDSEDAFGSPELRKPKTENMFVRDTCEPSPSGLQPCLATVGQRAMQQNSMELKSEKSGFEEKISEGNGRETEEHRPPRSVEINFQENGSFSPHSFAQTSVQCELQRNRDMESTRGSKNLTPASFQCNSLPAVKLTRIEAINSFQETVRNTGQGALYASQEYGKTFKNQSDGKNKPIHATRKPYECHACGKLFSLKNSLQRHKKIHTGEKPHCCSDCGKRFLDNIALERHRRVHTGEKPFNCVKCGKRYSRDSSLHNHLKIHKGEDVYFCSECSQGFTLLSDFHNHLRIHSGGKPYCCTECGKQYIQKGSLQNHIRIHTVENPHCCSQCGKRFSKLSRLQRHTRIHTGEKPYSCSECGKQFTCSGNLYSHTQIHTGEKPYCCSVCGKRFARSNGLRYHSDIHKRREKSKI